MQIPGRHGGKRSRSEGQWRRGSTIILLILLLCSGSATAVMAMPAQQGSAAVAVVPAAISKAAGDQFEVNITASGVQDLGAFELSLRYDPALIQIDKVTIGEFIGSTDRTVLPLGPSIDAAGGQLEVGALTAGALPGAQGNGVLVALSCTALRAGEGQLTLAQVRLIDTKAQPIAAVPSDGEVVFTGDIVVPTATAAPVTPTATPLPLRPTATLIPTATAVPPSPTAAATATTPPTETAVPASATPAETLEPLETRIRKIASATVQARQTAMTFWTATPTATVTPTPTATYEATATPKPEATAEPAAATTGPSPVPGSTPGQPAAPESQSNAGLAIGLGAAAVALGVGGAVLWRRGRHKSS